MSNKAAVFISISLNMCVLLSWFKTQWEVEERN